jgi:osmoprotectant transport system permease protein
MGAGRIEVTDLYSTDAEIEQYKLRVLEDDRAFFPEYRAVVVARADLESRAPAVVAALRKLEGRITEEFMVAMNAAVKIDKQREADVVTRFLARPAVVEEIRAEGARSTSDRTGDALANLPRMTWQHLVMVLLSLIAAVIVAVPLGVAAHRHRRFGQVILAAAGIVQTVPSIALLVLLIPLVGIGWWPAVIALFLYSLLPIIRNTHAGLSSIDPQLIESADALGLGQRARLRLVELPLAARSILAGVKIAAVINVGTATLGGFIGAGGYGEAIFAGISRQDNVQILSGALPAAALALLVQGLFELAERAVVPKGLRLAN